MGNYDCPECSFVTTNFTHYKMHRLYSHKPTPEKVGKKLQKLGVVDIDKISHDVTKAMREDQLEEFHKSHPSIIERNIRPKERIKKEDLYEKTGTPIRPSKPTQKDRNKIIQAKLQKLGSTGIKLPEDKNDYAVTGTYTGEKPKTPEERLDYLFMHDIKPGESKEELYKQNKYIETGTKIRPRKPGTKDYQKIISAQLSDLKANLMEARIAIEHKHQIVWRGAKIKRGTELEN